MNKYGIDVSHWQGHINWKEVKASGKSFAIIKAGGSDKGFYRDPRFEYNYAEAVKAGLNVGCYYFVGSKFLSAYDGKADAERFLGLIRNKKFDYPIYLDIETTSPVHKAGATRAAIEFCKTIEKAGYYVGIYSSDISGFKERLYLDDLKKYDKWVASYSRAPIYVKHPFGMWQYSSKGRVKGIKGDVDLNISYYDFPSIIKRKHLNGY